MSIETMTKLATTTLNANTASVTFSNIPQTYTDLRISVSGRTTGGVGDSSELGSISLSLGSTSYTYSDRFIGGNGTAAYSSSNSTTGTSNPIYWINGSGSTASTFASVNIDIPNYTLNNLKNISYEAAPEYNGSTLRMISGAISTTKTDAITQIVLTAGQTAFATNSTFTLYGVKAARTAVGNSIKAVGGNISFDGTYVVHTFNTSGTFTPSDSLRVDYLVVAGGGGGGTQASANTGGGAGGGAGGLRSTVSATGGGGSLEPALSLTAGTAYTVTVGAGGAGATTLGRGATGSNSVFSTITSSGGGGGGGGYHTDAGYQGGANGGSGGGAHQASTSKGTGTANQGYDGGDNGGTNANYDCASGGGGAGAVGGSASKVTDASNNPTNTLQGKGGDGGVGVAVAITGSPVYYAGGGGGGNYSAGGVLAVGGNGGGGYGGGTTSGITAANGSSNTGGGGGGGGGKSGQNYNGGTGGSGVVIIRYRAIA